MRLIQTICIQCFQCFTEICIYTVDKQMIVNILKILFWVHFVTKNIFILIIELLQYYFYYSITISTENIFVFLM